MPAIDAPANARPTAASGTRADALPVADELRGLRDVALREPEQRELRLRVPAPLVGLEQDFLGAREITSHQPDPTELAERPAELAAQVGSQLVACAQRLAFRDR